MARELISAFVIGFAALAVYVGGAFTLAPLYGPSFTLKSAHGASSLACLFVGGAVAWIVRGTRSTRKHQAFWVVGAALALFPFLRPHVLGLGLRMDLPFAPWLTSAVLFGIPLFLLSTLCVWTTDALVERSAGRFVGVLRAVAVTAAGAFSAGVVILLLATAAVPSRLWLAATGAALVLTGALLARAQNQHTPLTVLILAAAPLLGFAPKPSNLVFLEGSNDVALRVIERVRSVHGLVEVVEGAEIGRSLYVDGLLQEGVDLDSNSSFHPFTEYMSWLAHRHHAGARSALVLGLRAGVLARTLGKMGLSVTAIEANPAIVRVARDSFELAKDISIKNSPVETFLAEDQGAYDLAFFDAAAEQTFPSHLFTPTTLHSLKARLAKRGRFIVHTITEAHGKNDAFEQLERSLRAAFPQVLVYVEYALPGQEEELVSAVLVAGAALTTSEAPYPLKPARRVAPFIGDFSALTPRPARMGKSDTVGNLSKMNALDAHVRMRRRKSAVSTLGIGVLQD